MSRLDTLRTQLQHHDGLDDRERAHRDAMLELLGQGERSMARDNYDPGHFTASAFVLSPDESRLLLILHGKLGLWLQPGGHTEPSDASLVAAARREVAEEVGLGELTLLEDRPFDVDVHRIPPFRETPAHRHFDVRYLFRAQGDALAPDSDAKDARWVELDAIEDMASDDSVMRAVRRLRAMLLGRPLRDPRARA